MPWNGIESAKQVHLMGKASFPAMNVTTDDLITEDDRVVQRRTQAQTHTGEPFMNIPASNQTLTFPGIRVYRISNGKIIEHGAKLDLFGMLVQMGAIPMPGR